MAITLYHCPNTRSNIGMYLLEELGAPYDVEVIDIRAGAGQTPAYLSINPMGKVPAIRDGNEAVSEIGAICIYLGDKHPEANLAPPIGDPRRGAYLRWLFFNTSLDTVLMDKMMSREPISGLAAGYGDYERVTQMLRQGIEKGPWLLGDQFTTADVAIGASVPWAMMNGAIPRESPFTDYAARIEARPAHQRASARWGLANP